LSHWWLKVENCFLSFFLSAYRHDSYFVEAWDDAAYWLVQIINDEYFQSSNKKVATHFLLCFSSIYMFCFVFIFQTRHDFWMTLCEVISRHAEHVTKVNPEELIRSGLKQFSSDGGKLWTTLADSYIRRGLFAKVCVFGRFTITFWELFDVVLCLLCVFVGGRQEIFLKKE
jgi:hypothetical protein